MESPGKGDLMMYIVNRTGLNKESQRKRPLSPLFGAHMIYDHLSQCQPCQARRRVR